MRTSYTTRNWSPWRRSRRKSILELRMSAICMVTESGMPAASVAPNSEERMVPTATRVCCSVPWVTSSAL
ncbi:Uncharacterised protein [Bordetella pertussis]|nr:Uncharacterised protein [Bordetella pertussis]